MSFPHWFKQWLLRWITQAKNQQIFSVQSSISGPLGPTGALTFETACVGMSIRSELPTQEKGRSAQLLDEALRRTVIAALSEPTRQQFASHFVELLQHQAEHVANLHDQFVQALKRNILQEAQVIIQDEHPSLVSKLNELDHLNYLQPSVQRLDGTDSQRVFVCRL